MNQKQDFRRGFSLIEMLIVALVIGILSSIVLVAVSDSRARARDKERKTTLIRLQTYLEMYKENKGHYPCTKATTEQNSGDFDLCPSGAKYVYYYAYSSQGSGWTNASWIPGITPTYLSSLPQEQFPIQKVPTSQWCKDPSNINVYIRSYAYISNGQHYAIISSCGAEKTVSNTDPFYDSNRPGNSFKVVSPGDITATW